VPENLKINGSEEKFNINVKYDTRELYGKVTATRQIVIHRD
jgi:hypothetical protein